MPTPLSTIRETSSFRGSHSLSGDIEIARQACHQFFDMASIAPWRSGAAPRVGPTRLQTSRGANVEVLHLPRVSLHALRHTLAGQLIRQGMDLGRSVAPRPPLTLDHATVYAKQFEEAKTDARRQRSWKRRSRCLTRNRCKGL